MHSSRTSFARLRRSLSNVNFDTKIWGFRRQRSAFVNGVVDMPLYCCTQYPLDPGCTFMYVRSSSIGGAASCSAAEYHHWAKTNFSNTKIRR